MFELTKDVAKFFVDRAQSAYVTAAKAVGYIDFPVPPNSNMRRTSSAWIKHYHDSGIRTGLPIATGAMLAGLDFASPLKALDFGAGVGRQVRYFQKHHPDVSLFACDVEKSHMDWMAKAYPQVHSYQNSYLPPLKYEDRFFDLVYSVSIFSHISEEHAALWLQEFARVVRPGGIACLTVLGWNAHRMGEPKDDERHTAMLQEGHFHEKYAFIPDAKRRAEKRTIFKNTQMVSNCDESYGVTYYTPKYVQSRWASNEWEIFGISEGTIDNLQDLIVLRRTGQ
ncbi:MAG TPA: class I SAM-dependent methyltransferase [Tepidisphaeraceae bacterium]|nr:class I SAM-dependent methyltransferase [Tepidisphaeraceae bacterium]